MKLTNEGFAIVERDSHIAKWVIEHKRLDFDQNQLPTYLPFFKTGGVLLNIGANIGCYAYAFLDKAKEIHCFEPNPEAFECLEYNMRNKRNVTLYNKAVMDKPVMCKVNSKSDNIGMAFVEECEEGDVEAYVIDMIHWVNVSFILIDCEGYELHVLKGAENTINKHKPVMVIEINDHTLKRTGINRENIFAWLTEHGYIYRNIYSEQGLNDDQLDIICFPK